jgi:hypothetical protein
MKIIEIHLILGKKKKLDYFKRGDNKKKEKKRRENILCVHNVY